jgi:hypothetical protein
MPKIKSIKLNGVEVPLGVLAESIQHEIRECELTKWESVEPGSRFTVTVEYHPTLDLTKPLFATEKPDGVFQYWFIDSDGIIEPCFETGEEIDNHRLANNNVFLTREAAEKALEIKKAVDEFKRICAKHRVNYYEALFDLKNQTRPTNFNAWNASLDQMSDSLDLVLLQHLT